MEYRLSDVQIRPDLTIGGILKLLNFKEPVVQYFRRLFKPGSHYNPDTILQAILLIGGVSISIILILATVTVYTITKQEITRDAKESAVNISRSMFVQYRNLLTSPDSVGSYGLNLDQTEIPKVDTHFRSYLYDFDILKIKIYNPFGKIIYSTDPNIIGKTDNNNKELKNALRGNVDSHFEKKDKMLDLAEETKFNVSFVETYVPIKTGNKIIGVFELYTDVTIYNRDIIIIVTETICCLAVILLLVFGGSLQMIKKVVGILNDTQQELDDKVQQLESALSKVRQLEGIIPICSYCKKIRDDGKSWHQLESYISNHSEAKFSHGICPECYERELLEINATSN